MHLLQQLKFEVHDQRTRFHKYRERAVFSLRACIWMSRSEQVKMPTHQFDEATVIGGSRVQPYTTPTRCQGPETADYNLTVTYSTCYCYCSRPPMHLVCRQLPVRSRPVPVAVPAGCQQRLCQSLKETTMTLNHTDHTHIHNKHHQRSVCSNKQVTGAGQSLCPAAQQTARQTASMRHACKCCPSNSSGRQRLQTTV